MLNVLEGGVITTLRVEWNQRFYPHYGVCEVILEKPITPPPATVIGVAQVPIRRLLQLYETLPKKEYHRTEINIGTFKVYPQTITLSADGSFPKVGTVTATGFFVTDTLTTPAAAGSQVQFNDELPSMPMVPEGAAWESFTATFNWTYDIQFTSKGIHIRPIGLISAEARVTYVASQASSFSLSRAHDKIVRIAIERLAGYDAVRVELAWVLLGQQ